MARLSAWTSSGQSELKYTNHVNNTVPLDSQGLARALLSMLHQPGGFKQEAEEALARLPALLFVMAPNKLLRWVKKNCDWVDQTRLLARAITAKVDSTLPVGISVHNMLGVSSFCLAPYPPQPLKLDPQSVYGSRLGTRDEYLVQLPTKSLGGCANCVLVVAKWIDAGLVAADQMFPGFDQLGGSGSAMLRALVRVEWHDLTDEMKESLCDIWEDHVKQLADCHKAGEFNISWIMDIVQDCFYFPQIVASIGLGQYCPTCRHMVKFFDRGPTTHHTSLEGNEDFWKSLELSFAETGTASEKKCPDCEQDLRQAECVNGRMPLRLSIGPGASTISKWQAAVGNPSWWNRKVTFTYTSCQDLQRHSWTGELEVVVFWRKGQYWVWMKKAGRWFRYSLWSGNGKVKEADDSYLAGDLSADRIQWALVKDVQAESDTGSDL